LVKDVSTAGGEVGNPVGDPVSDWVGALLRSRVGIAVKEGCFVEDVGEAVLGGIDDPKGAPVGPSVGDLV
jgi:hypothetical protein